MTVWEIDPIRMRCPSYRVVTDQDQRRDYTSIYDASGRGDLLNDLVVMTRVADCAGFYTTPLQVAFRLPL
jgi:3-hydroxyethyl bacteriochlorophyllide a dehydrogenase